MQPEGAAGRNGAGGPAWFPWLLLGLVAVMGSVYVARTSFLLEGRRFFCLWDDAMVSMRYARNLAAGDGLLWNPGGERVQGFSDPAPTLVMAALHLLPLAAEHAAVAVQAVSLLVLLAVVALAMRVTRALGPAEGAGLAAGLGLALVAPLAIWTLQGADTGWVALVLVAAWHALAREAQPGSGVMRASAILAAGVFVRLDVALFAGVFIGDVLLTGDGRQRRAALHGAALVAVAVAVVLGAGAAYYGDALPNTYHLKLTGMPVWRMLERGLRDLPDDAGLLGPPLVVFALGGRAWWRGRRAVRVALGWVVAAVAYDVRVGGDWVEGYPTRFVVPAVVCVVVLAAAAAPRLVARLRPGLPPSRRQAAPAALTVAAALAANQPANLAEWLVPTAPTMWHAENTAHVAQGLYLARHADPRTRLGLLWAGAPGYFSGLPALDMLGKSDRHIARLAVDRFLPGHAKVDWDYVMSSAPDVIAGVRDGLDARADFRAQYQLARSGDGVLFYLRRGARPLLHDATLTLFAVVPQPPRWAPLGPVKEITGP